MLKLDQYVFWWVCLLKMAIQGDKSIDYHKMTGSMQFIVDQAFKNTPDSLQGTLRDHVTNVTDVMKESTYMLVETQKEALAAQGREMLLMSCNNHVQKRLLAISGKLFENGF